MQICIAYGMNEFSINSMPKKCFDGERYDQKHGPFL